MSQLSRFKLVKVLAVSVTALILGVAAGCGEGDPGPSVGVDVGPEVDAAQLDAAGEDVGGEDVGDVGDVAPDAPVTPAWEAWPALEGEPVEGALEIVGGGSRLVLEREPFGLALLGEDGAGRRVEGSSVAGARHAPLAVGLALRWSAGTYYEPTLTVERRREPDVVWFGAAAIREAARQPDGGLVVVVTTRGDDGAAGPELRLRLGVTAQGVTVTVERPAAEALVYTSVNLGLVNGEGVYGFGELFDTLDSRGTIRELLTQASGASETGTNEVHVPVGAYVSTAGYGLYAEDRYPSAVDLGASAPGVARMTSLSPSLRLHLAAVSGPADWLGRYTALSGRPARVPIWALGPHFWRNENRDAAELLDDIARARAAEVPVSMVWIDRPWSSYYHNWKLNTAQFPDPEGLFAAIQAQGLRVMLHHSPQLNLPGTSDLGEAEDASEGLYAEFQAAGWLVKQDNGGPLVLPWGGGSASHIDYSHPGAVARVQELVRRATALGAVGTKMDWDEYLQPNLLNFRLFVSFFNGESNLTMKSWYSALYHKAIIEGFEAGLGEPGFHISRTGTPGDQVWNTCIWPGDLDNDFSVHGPKADGELNVGGLPSAVIAHQSLSLSGYPCFGSDIGGYRGGLATEEVLLRWMWLGVFSAITQIGGGGGSHMPWTADTIYSPEALEVTRAALQLRMRLIPYIHQGLEEAHRTGQPLVRPMVYAWPELAAAREPAQELQFLFGPELLVAPVVEAGAVERELWLPPGGWVDWWTGERLVGPGMITRPAPLGQLPLLVREGAVIPLMPPGVESMMPGEGLTSYGEVTTREVLVVPGEAAREAVFVDGVRVVVQRSAEEVVVEVSIGAPDEDQDARFVQAPEVVEVLIEARDRFGEAEPTSVTGAVSWRWEEGRVRVRLEGEGGRVVVR